MKVMLMDESERHVIYEFDVAPEDRDRKYEHDGAEYEAARQTEDGSWIYRKNTY